MSHSLQQRHVDSSVVLVSIRAIVNNDREQQT